MNLFLLQLVIAAMPSPPLKCDYLSLFSGSRYLWAPEVKLPSDSKVAALFFYWRQHFFFSSEAAFEFNSPFLYSISPLKLFTFL